MDIEHSFYFYISVFIVLIVLLCFLTNDVMEKSVFIFIILISMTE